MSKTDRQVYDKNRGARSAKWFVKTTSEIALEKIAVLGVASAMKKKVGGDSYAFIKFRRSIFQNQLAGFFELTEVVHGLKAEEAWAAIADE